ncbi:uncharacterized protein LOC141535524 isoform X2 [Cotesia typhae]|uniref:uncharacterized protein LOC141535524 isoform X2 n=1 Tax=Cotesia typhae TaxID=2053667 RepID=UPI003D692223
MMKSLIHKLSSRIIAVKSADEFYSIMGVLTREMLEFTDTNCLIKAIMNMETLHEIQDLREIHRHNIAPWARKLSVNKDNITKDKGRIPVSATIFAVQRQTRKDAEDSESECIKSLDNNLISLSIERKQNADSDSSSTELCDEPEHFSDSEDQSSITDNNIIFDTRNELQLTKVSIQNPVTEIVSNLKYDSLIDTQINTEKEQSMKKEYSSSVNEVTDEIQLNSASNDLADSNTLTGRGISPTKENDHSEVSKLVDKHSTSHLKSCSGNSMRDNLELNSLFPHSNNIIDHYYTIINDTVICENDKNTYENLFDDIFINDDTQVDNLSIPSNNNALHSSLLTESVILLPDKKLRNALIDYNFIVKSNDVKEPVNDSSTNNEALTSSNTVNKIDMVNDLKLSSSEMTDASKKINTILKGKDTLEHEQLELEMISNNLLGLNDNANYNRNTIDKKFWKPDDMKKSDSSIFHQIENFQAKSESNFQHTNYHFLNESAQFTLTDSDSEYLKSNVNSKSFENISTLKLNKYTSSSLIASDSSIKAFNLNPIGVIIESNSLDVPIKENYTENLFDSRLRSPVVTNAFEDSVDCKLQKNLAHTSPNVVPTSSPFFPILDLDEKSPLSNHIVEYEKNSYPSNNVSPDKLPESFTELNKFHQCHENEIFPFLASINMRPIVNLHVNNFYSENTNEIEGVNLESEFTNFEIKSCNEKLKNEESCAANSNEDDLNFDELANHMFENRIVASPQKSDYYLTDLNRLNSDKNYYLSSDSWKSDRSKQNFSNFNKKPCELKLHTSTHDLLKDKEIVNSIFKNLNPKETQSSKLRNICSAKNISTEQSDLKNFDHLAQNSRNGSENQYFSYKNEILNLNLFSGNSKELVTDLKIDKNPKNGSILTEYTKDKENGEKNSELDCKLGVWTKVKPRKKYVNGRRNSCDKAFKIMQENSAILHKILTCQAKKCLPNLEEITNEITISPINEEISKIFSPILEQIELNEHDINEEVEKIHLHHFNQINDGNESEYDASYIKYFNLPLKDDGIFHCHRNKDKMTMARYSPSKEDLVDHEMNEEFSKLSHNLLEKSPNTTCFLEEFSTKKSNGVGIIDIYSYPSNDFFHEFPKSLDHKGTYDFFHEFPRSLDHKDTYDFLKLAKNTSRKFSKCIDQLEKYHVRSTSPQSDELSLKSDSDIHYELEKLDKISSHISVKSIPFNMIQQSLSSKTDQIESVINSENIIADEYDRTHDLLSPLNTHTSYKYFNDELSKSLPFQLSCDKISNSFNKSLESSCDLNDQSIKSSNNWKIENEHEFLLEDSYAFHVHYGNESPHRHRTCEEIFSVQPHDKELNTNQEIFKYSNGSLATSDDRLNSNKNRSLVSSIITHPRYTHNESNFYSKNSPLTSPIGYLYEESLMSDYKT